MLRILIRLAALLLPSLAATHALAGERMLYCIAAERTFTATCTLENGDGVPNDHFEAEFRLPDGAYKLPAEFAFAIRSAVSANKLQGDHEPAKQGYGSFLPAIAAPEGGSVTIDPTAAGPMTLRIVKLTIDPALL